MDEATVPAAARRSRRTRVALWGTGGVVVVVVLLVVVGLVAGSGDDGGSSPGVGDAGNRTVVSPMERRYDAAVLKVARMLYAQQSVQAAVCKKTGFTPGADIVMCSLATADGTVTEPSEWNFIKGSASGGDIAAPYQG